MFEASKGFLKEIVAIALSQRLYSWAVQHGLVSVQNVSVHVSQLLGYIYQDTLLCEKCRHSVLLHWSDKWCGCFYSTYVETLLGIDMSAQVIMVKKSTISHPDNGLGLLISLASENGEVVWYEYSSHLYVNLTME